MSFTSWLGSIFATKGGDSTAVPSTFNQAQAYGMTVQQNQGRVVYGRGTQNLTMQQAVANHQSGEDTSFNPASSIFHWTPTQYALGALAFTGTQVAHAASAVANGNDIADEHGHPGGFSGLGYWFTPDYWKNAWNETAGFTQTDKSGKVKPGFGATVWHSLQGLPEPDIGLTDPKRSHLHGSVFGDTAEAKANAKAMLHEQSTWNGRLFGGGVDTYLTWGADPTILLGGAAKAARAANAAKDTAQAAAVTQGTVDIIKGTTAAQSATSVARLNPKAETGLFSDTIAESSQRQARAIFATDNKTIDTSVEIQKMLNKVPNAAPIFALWDSASQVADLDLQRELKAHILGAATGNAESVPFLIQHDALLARQMQRISDVPEGMDSLDALNTAVSAVETAKYTQPTFEGLANADEIGMTAAEAARKNLASALQDAIDAKTNPWNQAELEGLNADLLHVHAHLESLEAIGENTPLAQYGTTALDRAKGAIQGGISKSYYYQRGAGGVTVRVLHLVTSQHFRGHIDTMNVQRGAQELMDYMHHTKMFTGDQIAAANRSFLTTASLQGRNSVTDKVIHQLYAAYAVEYDLTPEAVADLVKTHGSVMTAARHYSTNELQLARQNGAENVIIKSPFDDAHTSVKTGVYDTHVKGKAFLPDHRDIESFVKAEKGFDLSRGQMAYDAASHFNNRLNHMTNLWRMGVLGRPGLLVRTQIDTQGRSLATLGGTAYFNQAAEALGHRVGKGINGDDIIKTTALAKDIEHGDYLDSEADRLQQFLAAHDDAELSDIDIPTLDTRAQALRDKHGALNSKKGAKAEQTMYAADDWRHATPGALKARIALLRAAAEEARNTERFVYRYRLGMQDQTFKLGQGTVTTRAYEDAQNFDDLVGGGGLLPGHASRQEALTHSVGMEEKQHAIDEATRQGMLSRGIAVVTGAKANRMYENANDYITAAPDHGTWWHYWQRGTDPLRNSSTGKRILRLGEVGTPDMVKALRNDPAVLAEYREMHQYGETPDDWLGRAIDEVASLAPTPAVRKALLTKGHMTQGEIEQLFAKVQKNKDGAYVKVDTADARPAQMHVQGPKLSALSEVARKDRDTGVLKRVITTFGDRPDMLMGRHPVYVNRYYAHFQEQGRRWFAANPEATEMPAAVQAKIERISRHRAVMDVHQTMYDTAKYTGAMAALRWASPFMGAWQDALESWTRLFYEDPARAGAFSKIFNVPNRMGMVIDQDGNPVAPGQHADQTFVVLPGELSNDFANGSKIAVRKQSFNTMFQGPQWWSPGTGPLFQIPAQELTAHMFPELGDSDNPIVKAILPFGTPKTGSGLKGLSEDVIANLAPSYAKDLYGAFYGASNVAAFQSAYNVNVIQARKDGHPPTTAKDWKAIYDKSLRQARNAGFIKAASIGLFGFSGAGSNIADYYQKQYNLYVSGAKQLPPGKSPSEAFVEAFPEAEGLSFGLRKSQTGIQAYVKNIDAEKAWAPEIAANPKWGWAYLGAQNVGGQFSQSAYNYQSSHMIGDKPERFLQSKEEIANNTQAEDGWAKYNSFMTGVNLWLDRYGIKSLRSNAAKPIADRKAAFVQKLEQDNPAWGKDYTAGNPQVLEQFLTYWAEPAMNDPRLKSRPDVVALKEYTDYRTEALKVAAKWGYKSITGEHTATLAEMVAAKGRELAASDPGFEQNWKPEKANEVDHEAPNPTKAAPTP